MGEENCRSWEEEMYWTHFQFTHFSQLLHSGFDQQLAIPEYFRKNLKNKLPEIVTLKGPSGCTWEVGLKTNDNVTFFNHGWQEFVRDHSLREKDLLVFKYNGDSRFDVLMFDGENLCEKASSYFVRKCGHREHDNGCCHTRRKIGESSSVDRSPPDVHGATPPENAGNIVLATPPLSKPTTSKSKSKKTRRESDIELSEPSSDWQWERVEEHFWDEEIETKPDVGQFSDVVYNVPYISSRRLVSEEEKQNALQLAQATLTSHGFIQIMKPTHVHRKFYMVIPSGWMVRHLEDLLVKDVILRINENTWRTRFAYQKSRNSGGLSLGWRNFAVDNNLQEFDVCVFEPGSPVNYSIVLDVSIFRV